MYFYQLGNSLSLQVADISGSSVAKPSDSRLAPPRPRLAERIEHHNHQVNNNYFGTHSGPKVEDIDQQPSQHPGTLPRHERQWRRRFGYSCWIIFGAMMLLPVSLLARAVWLLIYPLQITHNEPTSYVQLWTDSITETPRLLQANVMCSEAIERTLRECHLTNYAKSKGKCKKAHSVTGALETILPALHTSSASRNNTWADIVELIRLQNAARIRRSEAVYNARWRIFLYRPIDWMTSATAETKTICQLLAETSHASTLTLSMADRIIQRRLKDSSCSRAEMRRKCGSQGGCGIGCWARTHFRRVQYTYELECLLTDFLYSSCELDEKLESTIRIWRDKFFLGELSRPAHTFIAMQCERYDFELGMAFERVLHAYPERGHLDSVERLLEALDLAPVARWWIRQPLVTEWHHFRARDGRCSSG